MNTNNLTKALQKLQEAVNEIKVNQPPESFKTVFGHYPEKLFTEVDNLSESMYNLYGNNKAEVYEVQFYLNCEDLNEECDPESIIEEQYPEFSVVESDDTTQGSEYHYYAKGYWFGDIDSFLRLTHHAEPFYNDTSIEYTHVEVCIDGEWHGGKDHENIIDIFCIQQDEIELD